MSAVPQQDKYKGLIDALRRIPQREGFLVRYISPPITLSRAMAVSNACWAWLSLNGLRSKDIDGDTHQGHKLTLLYVQMRNLHECALQALYRGNGANVLRLVPEVGLKFALNDQFRTMFTPSDGRPIGFEGRLAAGAATGVLKVLLIGMQHSHLGQHRDGLHAWCRRCSHPKCDGSCRPPQASQPSTPQMSMEWL